MKRLILLRHAKSDWNAAYGADHDRPLNGRGRRAARAMGIVLARSGEVPDAAISSSALRARATLELAAEAGGWDTSVVVTGDLYGTSPDGALAVLGGAADESGRVMLVGHQPTWGALTRALTGASVDVKTATAVGIDLPITSWSGAADCLGTVAYVLSPRLFTDGTWDLA